MCYHVPIRQKSNKTEEDMAFMRISLHEHIKTKDGEWDGSIESINKRTSGGTGKAGSGGKNHSKAVIRPTKSQLERMEYRRYQIGGAPAGLGLSI